MLARAAASPDRWWAPPSDAGPRSAASFRRGQEPPSSTPPPRIKYTGRSGTRVPHTSVIAHEHGPRNAASSASGPAAAAAAHLLLTLVAAAALSRPDRGAGRLCRPVPEGAMAPVHAILRGHRADDDAGGARA